MPTWIAPADLKYDALRVLGAANRRFPLRAVTHLIDGVHLEDVLALVHGPYDDEDRRQLILLTGVFTPDSSVHAPPQLMRCLREAFHDAPADEITIARVRAARELVAAQLLALGHEGTATDPRDNDDWYEDDWDEDDWDEDDWDEDDWDDPAERLAAEAFALDVLLSVLAP